MGPMPGTLGSRSSFARPDRTALNLVGEIPGDVVRLALEPADVLLDAAVEGLGRDAEAILLCSQHLQQLPTAGEERVEQLGRRAGGRAGQGAARS